MDATVTPVMPLTFSTQPRVETAGTPTPPNVSARLRTLSVLNHESKRLEPGGFRARYYRRCLTFSTQPRVETAGTKHICPLQYDLIEPFSTQPRVETAGTTYLLPELLRITIPFQYSTTSRNGWNLGIYLRPDYCSHFQYSTTSRNGWNRLMFLLSKLPQKTFSTQPRVETAGTSQRPELVLTIVIFQYSTTSRNGWNYLSYTLTLLSDDLSVLNHESKRLEQTGHCATTRYVISLSVLNHESKRLEPIPTPPTCNPDILSVLNHESKRLELIPARPGDRADSNLSVLNHESKL